MCRLHGADAGSIIIKKGDGLGRVPLSFCSGHYVNRNDNAAPYMCMPVYMSVYLSIQPLNAAYRHHAQPYTTILYRHAITARYSRTHAVILHIASPVYTLTITRHREPYRASQHYAQRYSHALINAFSSPVQPIHVAMLYPVKQAYKAVRGAHGALQGHIQCTKRLCRCK